MFFSSAAVTGIILTALLGSYLLQTWAERLNLHRLDGAIPPEFEGIYLPEKYRSAQAHIRATTRFSLLQSTAELILILGFWFAGGFSGLDILVRSWSLDPILTGLAYVGILSLGKALLFLPFSIYSTFGIEQRFGFNTTTPGLFVSDLLKSLALSLVLGGTLLYLVLLILEQTGSAAWFFCWIVSVVFLLGMQYFVPTWILPLFNRFAPLEAGALRDAILVYARKIRFPLDNVMVMDGSRRSTRSNAFFTGFGQNRRIVLFDTLIRHHTIPELVAVLAHEMGHFKKKHIIRRLFLAILQMGLLFFLMSLCLTRQELFDAFFMKTPSYYAGLIFFSLLFSPLQFFLSLLGLHLSRQDEFAADRFAADTIDDPEQMIRALKTLSVHNLTHLTPHPLYVRLNHSHPPVLERIRAIRKRGGKRAW